MMQPRLYKEAGKIWQRLTEGIDDPQFTFDLERYRGMLQFFQAGEYYFYIFNISQTRFDYISSEITAVLGYAPETLDVPFMVNCIHPEDQPYFLNFEYKATEFYAQLSVAQLPTYKMRYDYRIRKSNGSYIRILQQIVPIQWDSEGHILRSFIVHTDITHLKPTGVPMLSFISLDGGPSYVDVAVVDRFSTRLSVLTPREQELLPLLAEGLNSLAISKRLFISKQTVDTHRKNLLRKTGCANTAALATEAVRQGWI